MYQANNNISDKELNSKYNELNNISDGLKLIVIDEAQNFFNKKSDILNWFVTYHRHFNIELILISQLVLGIHTDHRIFNNVYEALNPSKQFVPNKIRYNHYLGLPANSSNYLKKDNLTIDDNVFSLYGSGGKVKKKNVVIFPILILILFIFALFYGFSYALDMFSSEDVSRETLPVSVLPVSVSKPLSSTVVKPPKVDYSNKKFATCTVVYNYDAYYSCDIPNFINFPAHKRDVIYSLLDAEILFVSLDEHYSSERIIYDGTRLSIFDDDIKKDKPSILPTSI